MVTATRTRAKNVMAKKAAIPPKAAQKGADPLAAENRRSARCSTPIRP